MAIRPIATISFVVATLLAAVAPIAAHPLSVSYSRWTVQGRAVQLVVRLPLDDVDLLLRLDRDLDGTVTDTEIERGRDGIARYVAERVRVDADGAVLAAVVRGVSRWTDRSGVPHAEARLAYPASRAIDTVMLQVRVLTDLYAGHRNLGEIEEGDRRIEFVFQHAGTLAVQRGAGTSRWGTATSFLSLGIEHIFTGYDHIVFLFGLLVVGRGFRQLIAVVTAFTIAHSTTLTLATIGVVAPAVWTVEGAIALSIAYVGIENLVSKDLARRWRIAFVFGLVHGFGFANFLRAMDLPRSALAVSLFTFNAGVEIGQVAIVALMYPLLRAIQRTAHHERIVRYASVVILVMGLYWFYERVF